MAKTLEQLSNKLRIRYVVKAKKYYLYFGSTQIRIDGEYQKGFNSHNEAKKVGLKLEMGMFKDSWVTQK